MIKLIKISDTISDYDYNVYGDYGDYYRSSQLKNASNYAEFVRSMKLPPSIYAPATLKAFELGHFAEYALSYNMYSRKHVIFNKENRPEPEKTMASKANKAWAESLTDGVNPECVLEIQDIEFCRQLVDKDALFCSEEMADLIDLIRSPETKKQRTVFWERDGVKLRTRPDYYNAKNGLCIDFKTTIAKNNNKFGFAIKDLNMWLQAKMQIEGLRAGGCEVKTFLWLVLSKTPPYNIFAVVYTPASQLRDEQEYARILGYIRDFESGVAIKDTDEVFEY